MKILLIVLSYLLGSFPSGYIFFWLTDKKDIRKFGSGSTGATNFLRVKGPKLAALVSLLDILKGAIPVYLALKLFPDSNTVFYCGLLAVLGHCFPVYLKFKGGKGVATTVGVLVILALKPFLLTLAVFILVIAITRYVSLGSMLSALSFPLFTLLFNNEKGIILLGLVLSALILIRHSTNIQRIIKGNERKLGEKVQ